MATNKRTYPNNYFAWYNDDNRLAILSEDTTVSSGERTKEKYDTYQGDDKMVKQYPLRKSGVRALSVPRM